MVMDAIVADKIRTMEEEKVGRRKGRPSRAMLRSILLSILHV